MSEPRARPNILFLLTDNQRDDQMGCAGNPIIQTPNMDRLAEGGTRFANAFVTTPICAASRASILTGLYETMHEFTFYAPPLRTEFTGMSYPALLKAAGYRTGFIGKLGVESNGELLLEDKDATLAGMFDHFDDYQHWGPDNYFERQPDGTMRHLTDVTGDKVIEFLRDCRADQPFCLSVSFNAPHAQDGDPRQYIWPPGCDGLYDDATIPEPWNADPAFFDALPEFLKNSESRVRWQPRFSTPDLYQRMMRGLYRMISGVDVAMGRMLDELARLALAENTVIIFMSDNGMFFGDRGLSDCWLLNEESIRVPLIVFDPRTMDDVRGVTRDEIALNVDIAPTIIELAGLAQPQQTQGRSLVPLVRGERPGWRTESFFEHRFDRADIPKSEGVRTERWKYICYYEQEPVYEELYDLAADPHESVNLAGRGEHQVTLADLRERTCHWRDKLTQPLSD